MESFTTHTGTGIPLRLSNVDTDQIVPSVFLKRVSRTGFEDALFEQWRRDPGFVLNRDPYTRGSVLVAGENFGIGSSREHAVWALRDYGVRVVLAPRFGDIFRANAGKQGLVTGEMDQSDVDRMWAVLEDSPGAELTVDLEALEVRWDGVVASFRIDEHTRWQLINGLDDIDLTCALDESITAFEVSRPAWRPLTLPARTAGPGVVRPSRASAPA
jgi:3-isopropylmalate/(R)-2-methylmalate dehydratase small subunit